MLSVLLWLAYASICAWLTYRTAKLRNRNAAVWAILAFACGFFPMGLIAFLPLIGGLIPLAIVSFLPPAKGPGEACEASVSDSVDLASHPIAEQQDQGDRKPAALDGTQAGILSIIVLAVFFALVYYTNC